ncbi:cellulose binding domain-containing protein [Acaryochloris sp. IP29b_bin.148]|uniref:cellulose binding domain-containing protein n=1 Tax=Acaryochloris sp. IP29b_bin.148 TaxID=2969218 RepID=UPI0026275BCA|nr:cellulose binding domain-containing protein [Acaryochloris sp. IP29b_bin.148]
MQSIDFELENQWSERFQASISIVNNGKKTLDGWILEFEAPFEITQIWNAEILNKEGNRYTIQYADWNKNLAPGQTLTFGFLGKSDTESVSQPRDF